MADLIINLHNDKLFANLGPFIWKKLSLILWELIVLVKMGNLLPSTVYRNQIRRGRTPSKQWLLSRMSQSSCALVCAFYQAMSWIILKCRWKYKLHGEGVRHAHSNSSTFSKCAPFEKGEVISRSMVNFHSSISALLGSMPISVAIIRFAIQSLADSLVVYNTHCSIPPLSCLASLTNVNKFSIFNRPNAIPVSSCVDSVKSVRNI